VKISRFFALFMSITLLLSMVPSIQTVQAANPTDLFFSEYIEGSSNNKALEIYNGTGAQVNLATGGYNVQMYFNGSASAGLTINLTGAVADGDVYVIAQSSANATILAQADQTNGSGWFNGDDAVVLRKGTTIIDVIGQIGFDPGAEWGIGLTSTADNTLRRKNTVCAGDPNGSDVFDPSLEWEGFATDTFGGLGAHTAMCGSADNAPEVTSTYPADGANDFPINANLAVTFSEPVNVVDTWFTLVCSNSGTVIATVSGGPTSFTLDPSSSLINGETCTLTLYAANITDQDGNDPPDNMLLDFVVGFSPFDVCVQPFTPIYAIQGSGATAAITGEVTTQGVVVGDYEGPSPTLRGFFLQDALGDVNPTTSDGIFVFNGNNNSVNVGDVIRITGIVSEFQGQTQISASTIANCGAGTIAPVEVTLPFPAVDFPEQYEGMLVRLPQTLYVTEHFQLGRFGQVVVSSGARLQQPTNVVLPGPPAEGLQSANNLNRIIIDDALNNQNPDPILFGRNGQPLSASNTLRGGDTATGIVGVMTYTWSGNSASGNAYRVRPINALDGYINFDATNERPLSVPDVGGTLRVVGMNLLNFFNTFDGASSNPPYACTLGVGGDLTDCRGADDQGEFDRQWVKTVTAIIKTNADIVGLIELENDGYGPDSAIQFLVNELNAATAAGTYAFIDIDAGTGQVNALGTDAIKVGLIYKPAGVTPIGQTAALNTVEFVNGGDVEARNRPALAQAFETPTGGRFVVSVNHLKSKGSACDLPDAGDGQGNCNIVRFKAANALTDWLASNPTGTGDPDALIIGDLNSYAMEDPITAIKGAGYSNLIYDFLGSDAYSYVFDGQWGYLDHALGSASLATQVIGVGDYHINSDEPSVLDYNDDFKSPGQIISLYAPDEFRIADHDPVVVGLNLVNYPPELGDVSVAPALLAIGAQVDASVPFTDPDALDTHTATWDWGDGTTSTGDISESFGSGTITGSHVYSTPGLYELQVTVLDDFGNSDLAYFDYVVVYDPNGGFVTGGGWIDSPEGAYTLDPTLSGKATFGFVAKYKKGATIPEGNTEFQFKAGDLNFKSTSYEWLVVAGSKAQFKGVGTINGAGEYKFILTAVDGGPDTFRIKIWYSAASGDVTIYDNGPDQPIANGSIIVHKAK
jgi:uncharacterized protein